MPVLEFGAPAKNDEYHSAVEPNHSEAQTVKVDLMIRDKSGVTAAGVMAMHAPNIIRAFFEGVIMWLTG